MIDKIIRLLKILDVLLLVCFAAICLLKVITLTALMAIGIGFLMLFVAVADIEANPEAALFKIFIEIAPFLLALITYIAIRLVDKYRIEKPKLAVIFGAAPLLIALLSFPMWSESFVKFL
jgi:hypothetical protein